MDEGLTLWEAVELAGDGGEVRYLEIRTFHVYKRPTIQDLGTQKLCVQLSGKFHEGGALCKRGWKYRTAGSSNWLPAKKPKVEPKLRRGDVIRWMLDNPCRSLKDKDGDKWHWDTLKFFCSDLHYRDPAHIVMPCIPADGEDW